METNLEHKSRPPGGRDELFFLQKSALKPGFFQSPNCEGRPKIFGLVFWTWIKVKRENVRRRRREEEYERVKFRKMSGEGYGEEGKGEKKED